MDPSPDGVAAAVRLALDCQLPGQMVVQRLSKRSPAADSGTDPGWR
jgi:hypothetical protein